VAVSASRPVYYINCLWYDTESDVHCVQKKTATFVFLHLRKNNQFE